MTSAEVRSGTREDIDEVTEILTDAFAEDRLYQWMFSTQQLYRRPAPGYFGWVAEENLEVGEVFLVEGKGVVLGQHSSALDTDKEWPAVEQQPRDICGPAVENVLAAYGADRRNHPKGTSHWYGQLLAVRREHHREDIGGLLLSHLASRNPGQSAYAAPPCSGRTRHATGSRLPRCGTTSDLDLNPRAGARRQDDVVGDGSPHSDERAATAEMCGARRKVNTAQVEAA
ncbi:hypothetical protein [Streptomyces gilvosporeus]|uniref:N-acetyltransferase domain-containing protein n=1 Tax=Streptomyces gilvosporeus TaxID=553510 RepID=A0A1V0TJS5_9ACTN|nr:hypothetical protein [Streptomyces gilvosporeus]ARF53197.1 hypothetical protein B1H19_02545 [Streptomyces gilvosporeus]